jgi:NitT/TauT family transport system ATP-binding protein
MKKNILLTINNLSKNYHNNKNEVKAIDNINIDVYKDEILAIVGPSGCGKSTLLSILAQLETPSDGKIIASEKFKSGYMLQTDSLFPWLTILDNSLIGLEIKNEKNKNTVNKTISLLKKYGIYEFRNQYPDNLSGGMRQRVALIRTLAINPDLLLLDEPYSALDYQTRLALSNDLYQIIKNEKKTAILITHDIAEAISLADRVIVLSKRPCTVKNVYTINLKDKKTPLDNRKDPNFNYYYDMIWRDLDVHL